MTPQRAFPITFLGVAMCMFLATAVHGQGTDDQVDVLSTIEWKIGPYTAELGTIAQIKLPEDFQFAGPDDTRLLLEAMQNPTSGSELGFVAAPPQSAPSGSTPWFVIFSFDAMGYVQDDEKDSLDADATLQSIREGAAQSNNERSKRGWPSLEVVGWEEPPNYDPETNNLVWAVRFQSEGIPVVNYNTRLLGRNGVMVVNLIVEPDQLAAAVPDFKELLKGYSFNPGGRYSEYRAGDKIAKYGLMALVAGGAGAVAVKSGLLKSLWKFIVIGAIAVVAFFRKLFWGFFGGRTATESDT